MKKAIFEIHPTKAPGSDRFNACVFPTLLACNRRENNNSGARGVEHWRRSGKLELNLNHLIPKYKKPNMVSDYRPLSLCDTTYKIVAKVIMIRLRK